MKESPIVEVLISAMNQEDFSICERTRIHTDCLIINQCNKESVECVHKEYGSLRKISTMERGLSRSRNMALHYAVGDYCLLADDDEVLVDDYDNKIVESFERNPNADIICFKIKSPTKRYGNKKRRVGYLYALKISSWQICMKRKSVSEAGVIFDIKLGSGTPQGFGEEIKFLQDCLKAKLKIIYVPVCLGEVKQVESKWFRGFTEEYFVQCGTVNRRLLGAVLGAAYCVYTVITKKNLYKDSISPRKAFKNMLVGLKVKL